MKCPSCRSDSFTHANTDGLFPCQTCQTCQGKWILLDEYIKWLNQLTEEGKIALTAIKSFDNITVHETKQAMLCPINGNLMIKYRIDKSVDYRVDYSPSANAVWLDKGEWDLIERLGLQFQLHQIVTKDWQRKIREEQLYAQAEKRYLERFGENDYQIIKEMREWVTQHPKSTLLMSFLTTENPWSVMKTE